MTWEIVWTNPQPSLLSQEGAKAFASLILVEVLENLLMSRWWCCEGGPL
jgi:hypothetical protein